MGKFVNSAMNGKGATTLKPEEPKIADAEVKEEPAKSKGGTAASTRVRTVMDSPPPKSRRTSGASVASNMSADDIFG